MTTETRHLELRIYELEEQRTRLQQANSDEVERRRDAQQRAEVLHSELELLRDQVEHFHVTGCPQARTLLIANCCQNNDVALEALNKFNCKCPRCRFAKLANLADADLDPNQCDGCKRGLKLVNATGFMTHVEKNGHAVMLCQKDRYRTTEEL